MPRLPLTSSPQVQSGRGNTHARSLLALLVAGSLLTITTTPTRAQSVERKLDDLGQWSVVNQPEPGTSEFDLYEIRKALAEGNFGDAKSKAKHFIKNHPNDPLLPEAYLARGQARQGRGDYYKALFDYEFIARTFTKSDVFNRALEHEFEIAKIFAHGKKRILWGFRIAGAKDEAEELLIRIQERLPGSKLAEKAGRELADFYYRNRDMTMAATAYTLYLQNYPQSADHVEAIKQIVYSELGKTKGPAFDPSGLYEANSWLETIDRAYPAEAEQMGADALKVRIRESDASRMLEDAKWFLSQNDEVSAKFTLKRLLRKYPATSAGRIAYRFMADKGWVASSDSQTPQADEANKTEPVDKQDVNDNPTGDSDTKNGPNDQDGSTETGGK